MTNNRYHVRNILQIQLNTVFNGVQLIGGGGGGVLKFSRRYNERK